MDYYEQFAAEFFESTVNVDMSEIRGRFLQGLPATARILDAGCGSGRDAKAFAALGHSVTAFDASEALAQRAAALCGFEVAVRRFQDVDEHSSYDGIWCCASLLHVAATDMPSVLAKLWRALRPGGRMYVSFKYGTGERDQMGRRFTDADDAQVRLWFESLVELNGLDIWFTADQRPGRADQWTNAIATKKSFAVRRLVTGGSDHFLPHLSAAFSTSTHADLAVAFVKATGLRLLLPELHGLLDAHTSNRVRVLTSDYLDITDPEALRLLLLLADRGAEVRVFSTRDGGSFHLKAYVFSRIDSEVLVEGTAFVGSSNISKQALRDGLEWNYRICHPSDAGFLEVRRRFDELFQHPNSYPLTDLWIDEYEQRRTPPERAIAPGSVEQEPPPKPTSIQSLALQALRETRDAGYKRGLAVLATGLGKTWLSAFDAAAMGARRILFVAHREEILEQAAATFVRLLPNKRVATYTGRQRDASADVLCASVQTLGKPTHLSRFAAQHFDYVVVDEFHHAAASTYRRLLAHFAPAFMLGLTATPDRTDQADILALCDDNLVYQCSLFDGIRANLLAPFQYFGIYDDSVNYREIPWRNGRFDADELSNKLATLARARHAFNEWQRRAQRRTLAFCVSTRHADFMAAEFSARGVAAAAVYSGSNMGRAQALELLETGALQVVFSVDLFNEGVDVPSIDTVMMLRPTESKILFLQQLGRGLRRHSSKQHLVVLDFIGNHQSFLRKPQALFGAGSTYSALADFARRVERNDLGLPDGCYVNYDLALIDLMKSLDATGPRKDYEALRDSLGRRPTLLEFYRAGSSVQDMRRQVGHWFGLVREMGDLLEPEQAVVSRFDALLREVEVTPMTKSFKLVSLEALLELDGLSHPVSERLLAIRSREVMERRPALLADLDPVHRSLAAHDQGWLSYWRSNPVNAWIGGGRRDKTGAFFVSRDGMFGLAVPMTPAVADPAATMLQELVDFRLASYEARREPAASAQLLQFPAPRPKATELPYFPNLKIACGHFRKASADADELRALPARYGHLDPSRHFIALASGNSMNGGKHPIHDGDALLLELITPQRAGSITGSIVAIERQDESGDNEYLLRVVTKAADGGYVLKAQNTDYADMRASDDMRTLARFKQVIEPVDLVIGQSLPREDIPPLFGEVFNPGNWNVGHVTLNDKQTHVLLVTLNKQGKADEHKYVDHWVGDQQFRWQSQNSTTPNSKRGKELIQHEALGIAVHLFVRDGKLAGAKAAPFTYFGRVRYVSHTGDGPIDVTWELD